MAVGVVLAGGSSSRMGADKPSLVVAGRSLLDRVVAAVADSGVARVAVSGRPATGVDHLPDPPEAAGPAAGLLAAMRRWPAEDVLLVAADQPLARPETLRRLLEVKGGDAVVPVDRRRQATCAVYRPACAPVLESLGEGPSLQALLDRVRVTEVDEATWRTWGEDGLSWRSIDTPDDLAWLRRTLDV